MVNLSVVVPVYNEEKSIVDTIIRIKETLKGIKLKSEIVIVNDGSKDNSHKILKDVKGIVYLRHIRNKGYGASLKTGIKKAKGEWIAITDADGTYPIEDLKKLIKYTKICDMVIGARTKKGSKAPTIRKPAKWMIKKLAEFLTGKKIPDINSGLRIFKKDIALRFWNLFPNGFSFTSTITVSSMVNNYSVMFIPIQYFKREGKSTISTIRDFVGFISLVFKIVMYFNPLKIFTPLGLALLISSIIKGSIDFVTQNSVGAGTIMIFLTGLQIMVLALIADLIIKRTKL